MCANRTICCEEAEVEDVLLEGKIGEQGIKISAHARSEVDLYTPMTFGHDNEAFLWILPVVQGGGSGEDASNQ